MAFESYPLNNWPRLSRENLVFTSVICVYIFLSPLYLIPSGYPQIADIFLVIGMAPALILAFLKLKGGIRPVYLIGCIFVALTFVINSVNFLFFGDIKLALSSLYYLYNFLVFIFVSLMISNGGYKAEKLIYMAIALTILVQIPLCHILPNINYREIGTFNNPNQLAYWSLLMAVSIVFLKRDKKFNAYDYAFLLGLVYLELLALSKAGLITFSIFLFMVFLMPKIQAEVRIFVLFICTMIVTFGVFQFKAMQGLFFSLEEIGNAINRVASIGQEADDNLEARGYYRIINYPEYLIFGAGEGAFDRFQEAKTRELHSGLATILFSYGIFGLITFLTFVYATLRRLKWYYMILFIPVLMFGISSQTIRFTHFWFLLGLVYGGICLRDRTKSNDSEKTNHKHKYAINSSPA